jgi:hypothetical protein
MEGEPVFFLVSMELFTSVLYIYDYLKIIGAGDLRTPLLDEMVMETKRTKWCWRPVNSAAVGDEGERGCRSEC